MILRASLIAALQLAIEEQERYERETRHYTTDSALLAGWRSFQVELIASNKKSIEA